VGNYDMNDKVWQVLRDEIKMKFYYMIDMFANDIAQYDCTNMNIFFSLLVSKLDLIPSFIGPLITSNTPSKTKFQWWHSHNIVIVIHRCLEVL